MRRDRISELLALFGLPDSFSEEQLKQAYRDLVQVWHPDRHAGNERLRRKAEGRLKEINEGHAVLSGMLIDGRFTFQRRAPEAVAHARGAAAPAVWLRRARSRLWIYGFIGAAIIGVAVFRSSRDGGAEPPVDSAAAAISERLDDRNGFRQFRFGMSPAEAEAAGEGGPVAVRVDGPFQYLQYTGGPLLQLGDLPLDRLQLHFVEERLHRIEIRFSRNREKVYAAFAEAYGQSRPDETWRREERPVLARVWKGRQATAAILAERSGGAPAWDMVAIHDNALEAAAGAALDRQRRLTAGELGAGGLRELAFGMSQAAVRALAPGGRLSAVETGVGAVRIDIQRLAAPGLVRVGNIPLDEIKCHFFQDRLYRIDLLFSRNREELHAIYRVRFPDAAPDATWKKGDKPLEARTWKGEGLAASVLAEPGPQPQWYMLVLTHAETSAAMKQFQADAASRAAADI